MNEIRRHVRRRSANRESVVHELVTWGPVDPPVYVPGGITADKSLSIASLPRTSVNIMNLRDGRLLSLRGTVNPSRTAIHLPRLGAAEFYIRLRFGEGPTSGRSSHKAGIVSHASRTPNPTLDYPYRNRTRDLLRATGAWSLNFTRNRIYLLRWQCLGGRFRRATHLYRLRGGVPPD